MAIIAIIMCVCVCVYIYNMQTFPKTISHEYSMD